MNVSMGFTRALALAKRTKELSLELYLGRQKKVPNTALFFRGGKAIRLISDRNCTGKRDLIDLLALAKVFYSADQMVVFSDGGVLARGAIPNSDFHRVTQLKLSQKDPDVTIALMVVEATEIYQNIGFLPYQIEEAIMFGIDKEISVKRKLKWLNANEFHTSQLREPMQKLFATIMAQNSISNEIMNQPLIAAVDAIFKHQQKDISAALCDQIADIKIAEAGLITLPL